MGIKKISAHLFQKGISKENIEKAISSISSEEITGTLKLLYEKNGYHFRMNLTHLNENKKPFDICYQRAILTMK